MKTYTIEQLNEALMHYLESGELLSFEQEVAEVEIQAFLDWLETSKL